jgi:hypothetical protein
MNIRFACDIVLREVEFSPELLKPFAECLARPKRIFI